MKAQRRDTNETALVQLAERLGCTWLPDPPLDGWVYLPRMAKWIPVEIKLPEREGQAQEFTAKQQRLFRMFEQRGIPWFLWRTEADVLATCGARRAA